MDEKEIRTLMDELGKPFPIAAHEFRVGATNSDKTRGMALVYVDSRHYMDRLDSLVPGWTQDVEVAHFESTNPAVPGRFVVTVRVTIPGWKTAVGIGETPDEDPNAITSSEAQAFRRACVVLGLGRYLYHLPRFWCDVQKAGNTVVIPNEARQELYGKLSQVLGGRAHENGRKHAPKPQPKAKVAPTTPTATDVVATGDDVAEFNAYLTALEAAAQAAGLGRVKLGRADSVDDIPRLENVAKHLEARIVKRLGKGIEETYSPEAPYQDRLRFIQYVTGAGDVA